MTISALTALPLIGDLAKVAADITKSVVPLIQPFADVAAKALGNALDEQKKSVEFSSAKDDVKKTVTF